MTHTKLCEVPPRFFFRNTLFAGDGGVRIHDVGVLCNMQLPTHTQLCGPNPFFNNIDKNQKALSGV